MNNLLTIQFAKVNSCENLNETMTMSDPNGLRKKRMHGTL